MSRHCLVGTGPYSLQTQRTPEVEPSTHTGNFRFDTESGAICDESCPGSLLGRFAAVALDGDMEFDLTRPLLNDRPCVHVVSSEVMAEMQKPENAHAFFVLPSQFNGVEFPSHCSVVEAIEEYKYDNTGGPAAQLAAHPAIGQFLLANAATQGRPDGISSVRRVLRQANTALREKGVTSQKQMFDVINGYLKMPVPDCDETATLALDALRMALPSLRLLVTFDAKVQGLAAGRTQFSTADHSVNLVYASAVPINAYVNGIGAVQKNFGDEKMKEFQSAIARLLLLTQYFGSLRTAANFARDRGRRSKVFLMPLGGGVFRNPWESIVESIARAVELLPAEDLEWLDIGILVLRRPAAAGTDLPSAEERTIELLKSYRKWKPHAECRADRKSVV